MGTDDDSDKDVDLSDGDTVEKVQKRQKAFNDAVLASFAFFFF
jgi:hypothetical protein